MELQRRPAMRPGICEVDKVDGAPVVIRAGSVLTAHPDQIHALERYAVRLHEDGHPVYLVHTGEPAFEALARRAHVEPVRLEEDRLPRDPDWASERLATKLHAERLEYATDVPGVMTLAGPREVVTRPEAARLIEDGTAHGGMVPKLNSALAAASHGLPRVRIGSPRSLEDDRATRVLPPERLAAGEEIQRRMARRAMRAAA